MQRAFRVAVVALVVTCASALAQSRTVTVTGADVTVHHACASALPDGGPVVRVCATGEVEGARVDACESFMPQNATRRTQVNSLLTTARNVWLERQAFGVDAGSP